MYNGILPQKCKVIVSIFFQKFIIPFINFNSGQASSSIKYRLVSIGQVYQLIGCVNVRIFPFIMHFTTATRFCPSQNDLKFSIVSVLKFALFSLVHTEKQCRLYCMYLNLFHFCIQNVLPTVTSILHTNGFLNQLKFQLN